MHRPVVLIPDGDCTFAPAVVRALGLENCWDVVVLSKVHRASASFSSHCADWQLLPCSNEEYHARFADILQHYIHTIKPDILLPIHEPSIRLTSQHLEQLRSSVAVAGVPEVATFDTVVDKGSLANYLQMHDLPHPPSVTANMVNELFSRGSAVTFPVLVKSRRSGFGQGIFRCDHPQALLRYLQHTGLKPDEVVIQQLIFGSDIDCSALCENGEVLAWTIQAPLHKSGKAYKPPESIQFIDDSHVLETSVRILRQLKWTGIAHLDFRYDSERENLYLLEINARYWGSLMGSIRAGINFPGLACRHALGLALPGTRQRECRYGTAKAYLAGMRPWPGHGDTRLSLEESALHYILQDPGPELVRLLASQTA